VNIQKDLCVRKDLVNNAIKLHEDLIKTNHGKIVFLAGEFGSGRSATLKAIYSEFKREYANSKIIGGYFNKNEFIPWENRIPLKEILAIIGEALPLVSMLSFAGALVSTGIASWDLILTFLEQSSNNYYQFAERLLRHISAKKHIICVLDNLDEAEIGWWSDLLLNLGPKIAVDLPVLFILSIDGPFKLKLPEENDSSLLKIYYDLVESNQAQWWPLIPVNKDEIRQWIGFCKSDIVDCLYDITQGNPEWVKQLWEAWKSTNVVVYQNPKDEWQFNHNQADIITDPVLNICRDRFKLIFGEDDIAKQIDAKKIMSVAALEGIIFTAQAVAGLLGKDSDEIIDFIDEYLIQSDDNKNGFLWEESNFTINNSDTRTHTLCTYRFVSDLYWLTYDRYGITDATQRIETGKELGHILIGLYTPEEDSIAKNLARIWRIAGEDELANKYLRIANFNHSLDALYQQAMMVISIQKDDWEYWDYQWAIDLFTVLSEKMIFKYPFSECLIIYQELYEMTIIVFGSEHRNTIISLIKLALLYHEHGKYEDAEPLLKQALAIREKVLSPEHPDVANSLNNLAGLYYKQGRYEEAEPMLKRALAIMEKALGLEHPDVAISLNNLAMLYYNQGRYEEAEPMFQRALVIREKVLSPEHPNVATSLNNLALLYDHQGRYKEAELMHQRALAIREKALGPEHPDIATSLNSLALLYNNQERYEEAEPMHQRALAIWEKALGPEHPNVATSLNNLAGLYYKQGRYEEVEPMFQRALVIREKVLSPEHPDVANSLNNLAGLYYKQGRYEEVEPMFQRALVIREKVLGPEHPDVAQSLNNLAELYRNQGRYEEAEQINNRLERIKKKNQPQ
jgi:tetratricopeptide (TPR) repeat protein